MITALEKKNFFKERITSTLATTKAAKATVTAAAAVSAVSAALTLYSEKNRGIGIQFQSKQEKYRPP